MTYCHTADPIARDERSKRLLPFLIAASAFSVISSSALAAGERGESSPAAGQLLQLRCEAAEEATGVIGRTVAFHTDGDGRLDLIAKVSDELIWVTAPDPLQHSSTLGIAGVTAFAAFERVGTGIGALVVAHAGGVELVVRDLAQMRVFAPIRTPLGTSSWAHARSVVAADVDGDGDMDIFGLSADGTQLLQLEQSAPDVFVELAAVSLGAELDELRAIQWSAGQTALAAILRSALDSACVIGGDGTLYRAESFAGSIDDIAVVRDAHAAGVDGLAVLSGAAITFMRPSTPLESPVNVAPVAPTSISAADVDADGRVDVLLNSSTVDQVTALLGQDRSSTGGATFVAPNAATAISIPLEQTGASMAGQLANPVGADFDRDGDIDIFQLIESTRGACVQRNVAMDETTLTPVMTNFEYFNTPTGPLAFVYVDALVMGDGAAPNRLEITISTQPQGAAPEDEEQHCLHLLYEVGSSTSGTGDMVTLPLPVDLGDYSTLLIRGFREDAGTQAVESAGVEACYRLIRTYNSLQRGTDSGFDWIRTNGGPQGTPPPPPPKPIDPFA
ncbi:hypothetical protein Poly30_17110 [Planctomycetes bacterium Poly30]|uniref:FG-GAP repeat protein n=1 Tax=Saltatorellus ferox TaxID=2528018 RepID=A0A518EQ31_9BACT|nr:hypothetical protein Poly30_17110 [Planctomycetes bacterium Poly30]